MANKKNKKTGNKGKAIAGGKVNSPKAPLKKTSKAVSEEKILSSIEDAVEGCGALSNFSCGGSIAIDSDEQSVAKNLGAIGLTSDAPTTIPPVVVRWDAPRAWVTNKVTFPLKDGDSLEGLLESCAPATFGQGGKDVLDEQYRKAGKIDSSQFSTNFHPHDHGILDAIAQALLPGIADPQVPPGKTPKEHFGITAELYKLNIYSAPSGKFKAHVDTPRGATQFGSLVVCLPHPHQGGELRVKHKKSEVVFDWGNRHSSAISWASFYSDCEHSVEEVKSGHRVTLTYNLYLRAQVGGMMMSLFPSVDPKLHPLYTCARDAIESPNFMKKGGNLGFFCEYLYAHTSKLSTTRLPFALKGIDVAVFTVFRALGLKVEVKPVVKFTGNRWDTYWDFDGRKGEPKTNLEGSSWYKVGDKFKPLVVSPNDEEIYNGDYEQINIHIPGEMRHVYWLNSEPKEEKKEVSLAFMTTGNENSLIWHYSSAAVLITVPSYSERSRERNEASVDSNPIA